MNVKYIAYAALGISIAALAVGIKALDETNTTNSLLGKFLTAKSKNLYEDDEEVNTRLDDYINEEEKSIEDDSDLDIEDLDKDLVKEDEYGDSPFTVSDEETEPTGGIEYINEPTIEQ